MFHMSYNAHVIQKIITGEILPVHTFVIFLCNFITSTDLKYLSVVIFLTHLYGPIII